MIKVTKGQLRDLGNTMFDLGIMERADIDDVEQWQEEEIEEGRSGDTEGVQLINTGWGIMTLEALGESALGEAASILGVEFEVVE